MASVDEIRVAAEELIIVAGNYVTARDGLLRRKTRATCDEYAAVFDGAAAQVARVLDSLGSEGAKASVGEKALYILSKRKTPGADGLAHAVRHFVSGRLALDAA